MQVVSVLENRSTCTCTCRTNRHQMCSYIRHRHSSRLPYSNHHTLHHPNPNHLPNPQNATTHIHPRKIPHRPNKPNNNPRPLPRRLERNTHSQPHLAPARALPQRPNNEQRAFYRPHHLLRALHPAPIHSIANPTSLALDLDTRATDTVLWLEFEWDFVSRCGVDGSRVWRGKAAGVWVSCVIGSCVGGVGVGEEEDIRGEERVMGLIKRARRASYSL
jgi:hypothetical protein